MACNQTIQTLRQLCGPHADEVIAVLGIGKEELSELILLEGVHYVATVAVDEQHREELLNSRVFWNWFKMYWYSVDAEWLQCYEGGTVDDYRNFHRIYFEVNRIYPSDIIQQTKPEEQCA